MNNLSDDCLDRLLAKARGDLRKDSLREDGFEGRLMTRLRENRRQESPWYLWAWRAVPLLSAMIIMLVTVSGVQNSALGSDLSHALTGGYEESVLVSYYTGE